MNTAATSNDQIVTGLEKSSAAMAAMGSSFEENVALFTAGQEITQNAEQVGNALRSISMRIRGYDEETEQLSEDLVEIKGDVIDLTKVASNNYQGVSLFTDETQTEYKSPYEYLKEISKIYDEIAAKPKQELLEKLFGKNRASVGAAILQNFSAAEKAMTNMANSAGDSEREMEVITQSLTYKINALKETGVGIAQNIFNREDVGKIIDGVTSVIEVIDKLTEKLGMFGSVTVGVGIFRTISKIVSAVKELRTSGETISLNGIIGNGFPMLNAIGSSIGSFIGQMKSGAGVVDAFKASFSSLWTVMLNNPIGIIVTAIAGIATAVGVYNRSQEQMIAATQQAAEEFTTQGDEIQSNIDRITELRTALESGTLTEEEAYSTKSELLSIQDQLSESYGNQVSGIDLVNGSLEEQIGLLKNISKEEAQRYLNENREGIEKAEKKLSKNIKGGLIGSGYYLGQYYEDGSEETKRLHDIFDKYKENIRTEVGTDGITTTVYFEGNAEQATQVLNDLMTDIGSAEKDIGESNVLSGLQNGASEGLKEANEILEKYQGIADAAKEARIITDTDLYMFGGKNQSAADWINDYTKAVQEYNDAISSGDSSRVDEAAKSFSEVDTAVKSLVANTDMSAYGDQFDEIGEQLDTAAIKVYDFQSAIQGINVNDSNKAIKDFADTIRNAEITDVDFRINLQSPDYDTQESTVLSEAIAGISSSAEQAGISTDDLIGILSELGVISTSVGGEIENVAESVEKLSFSDILGKENTTKLIDDFQSDITEIQSALDSLKANEEIDLVDLTQQFPELVGQAENLDSALSNLKADKIMEFVRGFKEATSELEGVDLENAQKFIKDAIINIDMSDADVATLREKVEEFYMSAMDGLTGSERFGQLDYLMEEFDEFFSSYSNAASSAANSTTNFLNQLSSIQSVIAGQSTGKSIDIGTFNSEELKDYRSALEYVNGTMQLNADKVMEITKAKSEEELATIRVNKANDQAKYLENAREIAQLRKKLDENNFALDESRESVMANIDSLLMQNSKLADSCSQYDVMTASIENATSAYANWLNAQNASQSGDMFDSSISAFQKINDTLNNTESESYGRIGNEDYKAAIDFVIPETVNSDDEAAINAYMDSISDLFTWNEEGNMTGLDTESFWQRAIDSGLAYLDETSDEYKILGGKTMEDFAEGMNLSMPLVRAMFGEMEEFGAEFDWGDEYHKNLTDMAVDANEAAEALRGIEGNENLKVVLDVSEFEDKELAIKTLDDTIEEMNGIKAKPDVDTSEIENADAVIKYCVAQKQELNAPAVMHVDTSQISGELGEALALLQEFQEAQNNEEILTAVGADTSAAEEEVNNLAARIQGLNPDIKAKLNINDSDVATITKSIEGLTPEMMVKAGVDRSVVDKFMKEKHDTESNVIYHVQDGEVRAYDPGDKDAEVKYHAKFDNVTPPVLHGVVRYTRLGANAESQVSGTAHASGTAKANGDWGTAKGGKTLVGELGKEIIVDPKTGKWYTVGDNGAEFRYIPKNAIVFNHLQTEQILKNGYIDGRGTSLVSGTAMVTGGMKHKDSVRASGGSTGSSTSGSISGSIAQQTKQATKAAEKAEKQSEKAKEKTKETIDFVEIAISRIQSGIERLHNIATNVYETFSRRNSALAKELKEIRKEIELQEKAIKEYTAEANSITISSDKKKDKAIKEKIRNGDIKIADYDDETADKIKEYQKWYEEIIKCKDAIEEARLKEKELINQKFENVSTRYEGKLLPYEHRDRMVENQIERTDDNEEKISLTQKLIKNAKKRQKIINKEIKEMRGLLSELKEGTEAYNDMLEDILDLEYESDSIDNEIFDYKNDIEDYYDEIEEEAKEAAEKAKEAAEEAAEKAKEAAERAKEAAEEAANAAREEFESIANEYEYRLSLLEHLSNEFNDLMDRAESLGYVSSKKYYEALRRNDEQSLNTLEQERQALMNSFTASLASGKIKAGTQEYYDMSLQIADVTQRIGEMESSIVDMNNAIRQVEWDHFDYLQDSISRITKESEFLIELLGNSEMYQDNGKLSDEGMATVGLHGVNYNTYMLQADEYAKQIEQLNREIAASPDTAVDLLKRRDELLEKQREFILSAEKEKQTMKDLVREGMEKEIDSIDDLITQHQNLLDSQKELYDFNKRVQEQTENIAKLRKQLAAYEGDLSEESRARVQQIEVELKEAEDELEETQYDKYISDQKKLLDSLYNEYEAAINERIDNIDVQISDVIKMINENSGSINSTLFQVADSVGYTLSTEMENIWGGSGISGILAEYGENFGSYLTSLNSTVSGIHLVIGDMMSRADQNAENMLAMMEQQMIEFTAAIENAAAMGAGVTWTGEPDESDSFSDDSDESEDSLEESDGKKKKKKSLFQQIKDIITSEGTQHKGELTDKEIEKHSTLWQNIVKNFGYSVTEKEMKEIAELLGIKTSKNMTDEEKKKVRKKLAELEAENPGKTLAGKSSSSKGSSSSSKNSSSSSKTSSSSKESSSSSSKNKKSEKEQILEVIRTGTPRDLKKQPLTQKEKESYSTLRQRILKNYGYDVGESQMIQIANILGIPLRSNNNITEDEKKKVRAAMEAKGYSKGVHNLKSDKSAWVGELGNTEYILSRSDGAIRYPLRRGDSVLNPQETERLYQFAKDPSDFLRGFGSSFAQSPAVGGSPQNSYVQNIDHVVFDMPNVKNYEEIIASFQRDPKFERLINSMGIDRIAGKSSMKKYHIN